MELFVSGMDTAKVFEQLGPRLRVEADHVIAGVWHRVFNGTNRLPHNRLFCIYGPGVGGRISTAEQSIEMRAGFVYHMPPHITYEFDFFKGLKMLAFHYDCHLGNGLDLSMGVTCVSERPMKKSDIKSYADLLLSMPDRSALLNCQGLLYQLAAQFVQGDAESLYERHQLQQRYQVVLDEIQLSGAETRIHMIAELMSLSVDQLSKRFRRDIGMPLKYFIDQRIAQRAAKLLRHTDDKIKQIAEQLHFRDEFTFSRFVKKHLHHSPRKYRNLPQLERV